MTWERILRNVARAAGPALRRKRSEISEITVDFLFETKDKEDKRAAVSCEVKPGSFGAREGTVANLALPKGVSV